MKALYSFVLLLSVFNRDFSHTYIQITRNNDFSKFIFSLWILESKTKLIF